MNKRARTNVLGGAALIACLLCWMGTQRIHALALEDRNSWPPSADQPFLPSPESANAIYLGYRQFFADVTWFRALVYYGSGRIGETDFSDLTRFIDNVIALDPKFRRVYRWAAFAVTYQKGHATTEEFKLSLRYLEKGIEQFPDEYELYWLAAVRYWYDLAPETKEQELAYRQRAAELVDQAMRKPDAPPQIANLAASLRTKLGQRQHAMRNLREMILTTEDEDARKAMMVRFREISELYAKEVAAEQSQMWSPEKLAEAKQDFDERWQKDLPYAPASLYVILGPRPKRAFDPEQLTGPGLFSLGQEDDLPPPNEMTESAVGEVTGPPPASPAPAARADRQPLEPAP